MKRGTSAVNKCIRSLSLWLLPVLFLVGLTAEAFAADGKTVLSTTVEHPVLRTITVLPSEHGSVTASATEGYDGDEVFFTFRPDRGCRLRRVLLNGEDVSAQVTDGALTVLIDGDMTVGAEFFAVLPNPMTGDRSHVLLWLLALFGTAASGAAVFRRAKEQAKRLGGGRF